MAECSGLPQAAAGSTDEARRKRGGLARSLVNLAQGRWRKVRNTIGLMMRATTLVARDRQEFEADNSRALAEAQAGMSDVRLHVEDTRELRDINYIKQGNDAFYSEDMLKCRHGLRTNQAVAESVQTWWR